MTRVVACITGPGAEAAAAQAREAEALGADLLEIRLDLLPSLEAALGLLKGRSVPVIATCRRAAEGGGFRDGERARRRALEAAAASGAAWLDLEGDVLAWKPPGVRVIGSFHAPEGVPPDAAGRVRSLLAAGADVAKLAATPGTLREAKALLDLNALAPGRVAAFGMGSRGIPTRLLAGRRGAWAVYAASDIGPPAAAGQLPLAELLFCYHFREVGAATALYGLLGSPLVQSPGGWAHTAAMRQAGVDGLYLPLDAADAADARFALDGFALRGASVTRPFKRDLLALDAMALEEEAAAIGALNTLTRDGKGWRGANTDAPGLRRLLAGLVRGGRRPSLAVFGAGGLARSALAAARGLGLEAAVCARRAGAAGALGVPGVGPEGLGRFDVVVQATPAGGVEDPGGLPFDPGVLKAGATLVEAHAFPLETPLTRAARSRGIRVLSGLELWLAQAREQFAIWQEREPPAGALAEAAAGFVSRLSRERGDGAGVSLALSGMRGAGKTTVGRILAGRVGLPFLDLDEAVSAEAGLPVAEVFSEQGEGAFRRLETRALARLALGPPAVLALGGGTPSSAENRELLRGFARVVLLEAPVETLRERLSRDPRGRPPLTALGTLGELEAVWAARREAYKASAAAVVRADADPETVASRVLDAAGRSG